MHRTKIVPSYHLHKASGQAVVVLNGKYHYQGKHDTEVSQDNYKHAVSEWLQRRQIDSVLTFESLNWLIVV